MNKHLIFSLIFLALTHFISAEDLKYETIAIKNQSYYLYPVQKSEGFYALKKRFGLSQEEIIAANPELKNGLKLGQKILIPIRKSSDSITTTRTNSTSKLIVIAQHKVRSSETLYSISRKYNIKVEDLLEMNPWASIGIKSKDILQIPHRPSYDNTLLSTDTTQIKTLQETYRKYKVRRKETLYSISRKYKVNIDELIQLNPWTTSGLKTGEYLSIPLSEKQKLKQKKEIEKNEEKLKEKTTYLELGEKAFGKKSKQDSILINNSIALDTIPINLDSLFALKDSMTHVKIAILLPFATDSENLASYPILEFYEGCLMSIEKQRKKGLNIEVLTLNTGKTKESITTILTNKALKSVNLIIGPAYTTQLPIINQFSQIYKIPTVLPFTSKIENKLSNKYLFQVLCSQNELEQTIIPDLLDLLKGKHLIILQPEMTSMYDKYKFVDSLLYRIDTSITSYDTIPIPKMAQAVNTIAKSVKKEIILMIPSNHTVPLMRAGEEFGQIKAENIHVFGFPEWKKLNQKELYCLPMYTFSSYYYDYKTQEVQEFFTQFYEKYGMPNTQQATNFALSGYDICNYFLSQLHENGNNFAQLLGTEAEAEAEYIQMDFNFQQNNNNLNYINKGYRLLIINNNGTQIIK